MKPAIIKVTLLLFSAMILEGCFTPKSIIKDDIVPDESFEKYVDVTYGDNRLFIYSWGSPLELIGYNRVKGIGLTTKVINQHKSEPIYGACCSEATYGVITDYSKLDEGILIGIDLAWDPRKQDTVPFIKTTIKIDRKGNTTSNEKIVLEPEEADPKRIKELTELACQALNDSEKFDECYEDALAYLRNIAIKNPKPILEAYETIGTVVAERNSAHGGEILDDYKGEIERIKEILSPTANKSE
jgi:hypothetical protein